MLRLAPPLLLWATLMVRRWLPSSTTTRECLSLLASLLPAMSIPIYHLYPVSPTNIRVSRPHLADLDKQYYVYNYMSSPITPSLSPCAPRSNHKTHSPWCPVIPYLSQITVRSSVMVINDWAHLDVISLLLHATLIN